MSRQERFGERDLAYSAWHRTIEDAHCPLDYIDLDAIEYCHDCKKPLALIELALDVGQKHKPTTVTRKLAELAGLPAFLVFYKKGGDQIEQFRLRLISPRKSKEKMLTPDEYIKFLFTLRKQHKSTDDNCG